MLFNHIYSCLRLRQNIISDICNPWAIRSHRFWILILLYIWAVFLSKITDKALLILLFYLYLFHNHSHSLKFLGFLHRKLYISRLASCLLSFFLSLDQNHRHSESFPLSQLVSDWNNPELLIEY
jgi:hypothetical protein